MSIDDRGLLVGIVLGSKSDMDIGVSAADTLGQFGIGCEIIIASAHRTPVKVASYAGTAASRGIKVIIAIAGLSAALPGVIAAHTQLPVIGVPVDAGTLGGIDALLAITQMPPGVPVAGVGIGKNGAKNAALIAVRILALFTPHLVKELQDFAEEQALKIERDNDDIAKN